MSYEYDVFISYSSVDKPWALKLYDSLVAKRINPFIDGQRLEVGLPWETQLGEAVKNSQHLVALWSNNAKQSDWVQRELARFDTIRSSNATTQAHQRLIFINLEGQNTAYTVYQMIDDLKAANAYGNGVENVDANLWQDVTARVVQAIRSDDSAIPIPVVILTMTQGDLDGLDQNAWEVLQRDLGLSKDQLKALYGDQRTDWHPFGSSDGIRRILERLIDEINLAVGNPRFRWELVGDDFWNDYDAARRYAILLGAQASLIVIDPIGLHSPLVYKKLVTVQHCFENDKCAIMVLPPFSMPTSNRKLRDLVRDVGQPVFDEYYHPPVPPKRKRFAQCGVNIGDEFDIKRLLLFTLAQSFVEAQLQAKPGYLRV